jgi:thymidylate kinase
MTDATRLIAIEGFPGSGKSTTAHGSQAVASCWLRMSPVL